MNMKGFIINSKGYKPFFGSILLASVIGLSACGDEDDLLADNSQLLNPTDFRTDLALPDSVTGGQVGTSSAKAAKGASGPGLNNTMNLNSLGNRSVDDSLPCRFLGPDEDDDNFDNGYEMTKFMVSAVATWTCIGDRLIVLSNLLPHDGEIRETDNDADASNYDPEEPTHFSITDASGNQTSVKFYYGFSHASPPVSTSEAGFFFSWIENGSTTTGRMIIDTLILNDEAIEEDDPSNMRMDINYGSDTKVADMYLRFGENEDGLEGFRIKVTKDLNALEQVYTAQGLIDVNQQWIESDDISELPSLRMFTVADAFGEGAAIAEFTDIAIPFPLGIDGNLGNYLVDKEDIYFFDADQSTEEPWDYIYKSFSNTEYRGDRTIVNLDAIETFLDLSSDYFDTTCNETVLNCDSLINAIFEDGFADQVPNQGSDPEDWRSTALESAVYLDSIYPNGLNWDNAFDQSF